MRATRYNLARESAGLVTRRGHYGDESLTSRGRAFTSGANAAAPFKSTRSYFTLDNVVDGVLPKETTGLKNDIPYSQAIIDEIEKVAVKIATLGTISTEAAEDFLYILISIDNDEVMNKIAEASEIPELADDDIMNVPLEILAVPHIEKLAFIADAIHAINKAYAKYTGVLKHEKGKRPTSQSFNDVMQFISGQLGITLTTLFGAGGVGGQASPTAGSATLQLGHGVSRVLFGNSVPMGVQSNNPALNAPSIVGRMSFGESPSVAANIDINWPIHRRIAVYDDPLNAAGASELFGKFRGTLAQAQSVNQLIGRVSGLAASATSPFNEILLARIQANVGNVLNVSGTASIDLRNADEAVPFFKAYSDVMSGISQITTNVNAEMRAALTTITSTLDGIENMYERGLDLATALQRGLTDTSAATSPISINIDVPNLFPMALFQQGWVRMSNVHREMNRDSAFYRQVLYILKTMT